MASRLLFGGVGAISALLMALGLNTLFQASSVPQALQGTPCLLFRHDPEIVKRLKSAGAQFGDPQFSLMWHNQNDLDLHVIDPTGAHISYRDPRAPSGGELDVDANRDALRLTNRPVENIYWRPGSAPQGDYQVYVHHYANHGNADRTPYILRIVMQGRVKEFTGSLSHREQSELIRINPAEVSNWQPLEGHSRWWQALLLAVGWSAGLGAILALLLRLPQRWFGVNRAEFQPGRVVKATAIGLVLGIFAGLFGQGVFALLFGWSESVARAVGFAMLGGFLGYGLAHCVPNLPVNPARWAGIFGGLLAFGAFGWAVQNATDATGRWLGAMLIGLAIGLMIAFVRVRLETAIVRTGGTLTPRQLSQRYRVEVNRER